VPTCDDLATKAELNELKDKINKILGAKGGGDYENVLDEPSLVLSLAPAAATGAALWLQNAFNSLNEVKLVASGERAIWKELASGEAKLMGFHGNGIQKEIPSLQKIGQVAGTGVQVAGQAAQTASHAAAAVNLLATLVQIGATLALNKATVDILGKRIDISEKASQDAANQVNTNMIRLYQKHEGDIDAVNATIEANKQKFLDQSLDNLVIKSQIEQQKTQYNQLRADFAEQQASISQLQTNNDTLRSDLDSFKAQSEAQIGELTEIIGGLQSSLTEVRANLDSAFATISEMSYRIDALEEYIATIDLKITAFEQALAQQVDEVGTLRVAFEQLKIDLGIDEEAGTINPNPKRYRLIEVLNAEKQYGGGGGGAGAAVAFEEAAKQQEAVLKLSNKLADAPVIIPDIHDYDVRNGTSPFDQLFSQLLNTINPSDVNQEQLDLQTENIATKFEIALLAGLTTNVIPRLDNIADQTTEPKIANAVQNGICQSLNGGGCPPTPITPNPTQGLGGANNLLNTKLDGLNSALGLADLAQGASILKIVKNTNEAVRHADYGLEKVQSFAATAWKATHADKILNGIGVALAVHNAVMLSRGLGITITETATTVLDAVGIRDESDQPFDVTSIVKAKMTSLLSSFLGEENYEALTQKIAKYNRIYQTGANVINGVQGLVDSARAVNELTASYTGKIGNALLNAGTVSENAYDRMLERVRPNGGALARLDRYREGIEVIEDKVSTIDSVASEVKGTKEQYKELDDNWKAWDAANTAKVDEKKAEVEEINQQSFTLADFSLEHFIKADTESETP